MAGDDEERLREKLRALKELRGQREIPQEQDLEARAEYLNPRRAKLRELLRQRQADGGGPMRPRGGRALRPFGQRAGAGASGEEGAPLGRRARLRLAAGNQQLTDRFGGDAGPGFGGGGGRFGNSGRLLRRRLRGRQDAEAASPSADAPVIAELQERVRQLTQEVEKLRADQAGQHSLPAPAQNDAERSRNTVRKKK